MQSLRDATIRRRTATGADECAAAVLDGLPPVMWFVRRHLNRHPSRRLSVPQYRFLNVLDGSPAGSLSEVAENLGMELPGASRLASGLAEKGLVARRESAADRRQLTLALTARGRSVLNASREETKQRVADELAHLTDDQRTLITHAMVVLRDVFGAAAGQPSPATTASATHAAPPAASSLPARP